MVIAGTLAEWSRVDRAAASTESGPVDRARRAVAGSCLARTGPRGLCRAQSLGPSPHCTERTQHDRALAPYQVEAFNTAKVRENKIHDDAVAKRFGFGGGLVPGVDVYAYMTHLPVVRWGRAWLERGTAECRFCKPVYDGDHGDRHRDRGRRRAWRSRSRRAASSARPAAPLCPPRCRRRRSPISPTSPSAARGAGRAPNSLRGRRSGSASSRSWSRRSWPPSTCATCARPRRSTRPKGWCIRSSCCACAISR